MVLGVGLGVLTGSALRWFAPQVQRQTLNLPGWFKLPETVDAETSVQDRPELTQKPVVSRFQPPAKFLNSPPRGAIAATQGS